MGYLFGILWCLAFGFLALHCAAKRRLTKHYQSIGARVKKIQKASGRNRATVETRIPAIGDFEFTFQDFGDYREGESIDCMWDGRNKGTAQRDFRSNLLIGLCFSVAAVVLMVGILVVSASGFLR